MLRCFAALVGPVRNNSTVSASASKGSRIGGGCHEANDNSRGNGCALSGRFCSSTDLGFGCDRCAVVPV